MKSILVFVPNSLHLNKTGFLEGVRKEYEECEAYYVTSDFCVKETAANVVGYLSSDATKAKIKDCKGIHIDNSTTRLTLINHGNVSNANVVRIVYDYKTFRSCDRVNSEGQYGAHFRFLSDSLRKKRRVGAENGRKTVTTRVLISTIVLLDWVLVALNSTKLVWSYSATLSHFYDNLGGCKWLLNEFIREKRLSPKTGNFILSKLFDVVLGILFLRLFIENEDFIVQLIEKVRETIIHNFRDLLMYLMGSPIGLKLNYAFNKSLGTFFFYHISLWRVFLVTMQPYLKEFFTLLVLPGTFGFSYQIAMLTDLISIATFHVYCIYVYAARLLYFQLKGLLSLWRLFIGRKYNALRMRVDSHQYSHHQLFIGTLGFTVFLFLLPTTTMYYTVFVIFRLVILIFGEILKTLRYLLQCLPFYVLVLFILKSPQIAGPLCLKTRKSRDGVPTFEAHLQMIPLVSGVRIFAPNTIKLKTSLSWGKIFTGVLL